MWWVSGRSVFDGSVPSGPACGGRVCGGSASGGNFCGVVLSLGWTPCIIASL